MQINKNSIRYSQIFGVTEMWRVVFDHGLQDKCVVSTCVEFNLYCTILKHFHTSLTVICIIFMLKHSPHL